MRGAFHAAAIVQSDWDMGHAVPAEWLPGLGLAGAAIAAGVFLVLLLRGLSQMGRYRATRVLGEPERAELERAIVEAERHTIGEIAVVVLERSDRHPAADWIAAGLSLLLGSALLTAWLPWNEPSLFFACQFALGAAGFVASRRVPGFKRAFVSEARAEEMAREQALQEFFALGLHRTQDATGVLLFVSLLERRVIVLGDHGIDAVVGAAEWAATDRAVLEGVRAGSLQRGLAAGIERVAEVLAEHFPSEPGRESELPNHVVVRAE